MSEYVVWWRARHHLGSYCTVARNLPLPPRLFASVDRTHRLYIIYSCSLVCSLELDFQQVRTQNASAAREHRDAFFAAGFRTIDTPRFFSRGPNTNYAGQTKLDLRLSGTITWRLTSCWVLSALLCSPVPVTRRPLLLPPGPLMRKNIAGAMIPVSYAVNSGWLCSAKRTARASVGHAGTFALQVDKSWDSGILGITSSGSLLVVLLTG